MNGPHFFTFRLLIRRGATAIACGLLFCPCGTVVGQQSASGQPTANNQQAAAAPVPSEPPFDGLLLLKNGGVVQGHLARFDDRWVVTNNDREMNVPVRGVELACRSMVEAYDLRRKQITRDTAEAHLALADWCLRYNLLPQAALELLDARALDPKHPRLRMLDERLAVASRPKTPVAAATVPQHQGEKKVAAAPPSRTATQPRSVTPESHGADESTPSTSVAPVAALPVVSDAALERFTRKIQPMLVNNCTTSGCHATGGPQKFQLDRALLHGLSNRQTTMANLNATLALIDRERPQLSPLVTVPRRPHGGVERAVFGPHQDQLVMQLSDWAALVAPISESRDNAAKVAVSESSNVGKSQPANPPTDSAVAPAAFVEAQPGGKQTVAQRYSTQLHPTWQPKDPFDPEIFNRQTDREAKSQRQPVQ